MTRSRIKPIKQPDEATCGPATLKIALKILGKYVSLSKLISLCKTDHTGTTTKNFINAAEKLGLSVYMIEKATLHHVKKILSGKNFLRVGIVSYMYDMNDKNHPDIKSGHFAVIASFSHSRKRIVLFDSYTGKRKSYSWENFRRRWLDFEIKRRNSKSKTKKYTFLKQWQIRPLFVLSIPAQS